MGVVGVAPEEDAAEHAVAVEPVCVSAQVFVCDGVAAIAHILTASELGGDGTGVGARC